MLHHDGKYMKTSLTLSYCHVSSYFITREEQKNIFAKVLFISSVMNQININLENKH